MAIITYKCPNCDSGLFFDPATQEYRCEYCQSHFSQKQLEVMRPDEAPDQLDVEGRSGAEEYDGDAETASGAAGALGAAGMAGAAGAAGTAGAAEAAGAAGTAGQQAMLYTCPSCGAEIVTDATTAATFCYYCHNPVVLEGRLEGGYEPDYVVPFQIDKKKAQEIFTQWMGRKKFVPKEFYSPKQIDSMTGVYFPYWLFSCTINGEVEGQGTSLRTWTTGDLRYTETKIYEVKRAGSVAVDNVARSALQKANRRLVDGVQPFEMDRAETFSMGYLSGFMAENRDMEKQSFEAGVQQEVKDYAISVLRSQATNYSSVKVNRQQADVEHGRWEYALLPVWTLTYNDKARRKIYYFALNGQTGKVCGELPVDRTKLLILFASIFLPMLVLFLIGGYLL